MALNLEQSGELWGTLYAIGAESDEPLSPAAVDWLIMRGFVENGTQGPQLNEKGRQAFKVMESGEGTVPELDPSGLEL
jgi:hypothetical protein